MSLKDLLDADTKSLVKLVALLLALALLVGPGVLLLFFEQRTDLLTANIFVLLGISAVLSLPFHVLGAIAYLHPFRTLTELARKPQSEVILNLVSGIGLWGLFSVAGIYALVHGGEGWLSGNFSFDLRIRYVVTYVAVMTPLSVLFSFNVWRLRRLLKLNDR